MGGRRRGRWGVRVRVELPVWISTYTSPKTVLVLVRPPRVPRPSRWWLRVRAADAWIRPASGVRTSRAHSVSWETLPRVRSGPGECAREVRTLEGGGEDRRRFRQGLSSHRLSCGYYARCLAAAASVLIISFEGSPIISATSLRSVCVCHGRSMPQSGDASDLMGYP